MTIQNNLFDLLEHQDDGYNYAVNLVLKSGNTIYLENLKKGEKDSYLAYAKQGTILMLISDEKTLWRVMPQDIERVDVKAYQNGLAKSIYPLLKFFMGKSHFTSDTFFNLARLFILVIILTVFAGMGIALQKGDLISLLFDQALLQEYIQMIFKWSEMGFYALLLVMIITNIADFFMRPVESFHILDLKRQFLAETKLLNLLITLAFVIIFLILKTVVAILIVAIL